MSGKTDETQALPFVKWAGGKRQLLDKIHARMPKVYNSYYEPFVGGGAVLFNLAPARAKVNDVNVALINAYTQVKYNPDELMSTIDELDENHRTSEDSKSYYYYIREKFNGSLVTGASSTYDAALFIYVNKHCFNGLYRVNSKGLFNVPYNSSNARSYSRENIMAVSRALQSADI